MEPVSIILTTVGWIIKPLASKLVGEVWNKYTKHVGLDEEAKSLKDELMKIQLLVEAAQSKQLPNEKVHLHRGLKDLKTLVYRARDLLDELDYFRLQKEVKEMNRAEQGTIFSRLSNRLPHLPSSSKAGACKTLKLDKKDMSKKINALVKELQQKYQSVHDALKLEQLGSIAPAIQPVTQKVAIDRQQTDAYYKETHIYGRDKERDRIIKLIQDGRPCAQELPVVAIVGHGGLGKTTLAQLVYNDPGINSSFDLRMWICVSTNFDVMGITRQMLEYCKDKSYNEHTNLNNLKNILEGSLKGKNVLLVLDDIWEIKNQRDWDSLLAPFASKEKNNMVLVTTRFPSIGDMVRTTDPIYLDSLDDSSFWSLFKKSAFGTDQYEVPYALENIGRELAKKLKGNPLAAKTVGALLKGNADGLHWMRVLENETWKSQEGDEGIMPALKMSYEYLPVHLQQCFSYCSLFPKDYKFQAEELVDMWMAQGYIYEEDKRKEDVGIDYLNILVERAFFQLIYIDYKNGRRYVIHDIMHDLAQTVSSEECLSISNPRCIPRPPLNLLHLYIDGDKVEEIDNSLEFKNLWSLIIIDGGGKLRNDIKWDKANSIRVLRLKGTHFSSFNFTSFVHLRFLELDTSFVHLRSLLHDTEEIIPDSDYENILAQICTLYHLEVLVFLSNHHRLPKKFNNLVNLRQLHPNRLHCEIAGVGKLKHLQELKFRVGDEKGFELEQLAGLKELKILTIWFIQNVKCQKEAESAKLSEKELDALNLSWSYYPNPNHVLHEEILEGLQPNNKLRNICIKHYEGRKSPSWLVYDWLKFLEFIELSSCESWDVLPNFGELRFLKRLSLSILHKVREFTSRFHGCSSGKGFPSLKFMYIFGMAELETWFWNEQCEVFPVLEALIIRNCPKLKELPNFGELGFLKELSLSTLPKIREFTSQFHGCRSGRGFPSLKFMNVDDMAELETWVWSEQCEVFSVLETLTIKKCPKLKELPNFVDLGKSQTASLSSPMCLKYLEIMSCPFVSKRALSGLTALRVVKIISCENFFSSMTQEEQDDSIGFFPVNLEILSLTRMPDEMSWSAMDLTSLTELTISDSPGLTFLDLYPFVALRELELRCCENLAYLKGPNSLVILKSLIVRECPSLASSWMSVSRELDLENLLSGLKRLEIDTL